MNDRKIYISSDDESLPPLDNDDMVTLADIYQSGCQLGFWTLPNRKQTTTPCVSKKSATDQPSLKKN